LYVLQKYTIYSFFFLTLKTIKNIDQTFFRATLYFLLTEKHFTNLTTSCKYK